MTHNSVAWQVLTGVLAGIMGMLYRACMACACFLHCSTLMVTSDAVIEWDLISCF